MQRLKGYGIAMIWKGRNRNEEHSPAQDRDEHRKEKLLLQFSSFILEYSLFLSFPIATIGEAAPCLIIAFSFSLVTILFPYLIFSSLIYRLIFSSTSLLILVSIPHLHKVLLVSFYFLS